MRAGKEKQAGKGVRALTLKRRESYEGRASAGFTLMELMVTMALAVILASWAIPGMYALVQQSRVTAGTNYFLGLLETSRYRAMALRSAVTVCASPDGVSCDRDGGNRLLLFEDDNGNGVLNEGETSIVSEELFQQGDFWLVWRDFRQTDYLRWAPEGRTDSLNGSYTLCNSRRQDRWLRQIVVNRAGRARLVYPARERRTVLLAARQRCGW